MASVRAKFYVSKITRHAHWHGVSIDLASLVTYEESQQCYGGEGAGSIHLSISPEKADAFVIGEEYYVDFTPVES